MDEFRGMKLVRKEEDKNLSVNITVDFDRTKHLSDASIKRRRIIRERFMAKEVAKEEEEKKKMQAEEENKERERFEMLFIYELIIVSVCIDYVQHCLTVTLFWGEGWVLLTFINLFSVFTKQFLTHISKQYDNI